ncbi:hypothetical protein ACFQHO_30290 [Actinomadura yumaensis]|uniref:hypothetical protein n=1 Tax=Actinomadura yumaensis TaxID=111807 RepID=UPI00360BAA04
MRVRLLVRRIVPAQRLVRLRLPGDPSASAAPSPLPTDQMDKAALKVYREYQTVYQRAYENNDPSELASVAADPILTRVTNDIAATKAKGEIWRFTHAYNPRVYARAKDGSAVYVSDCVRTLAAYRFAAKTGKRTGGGPGDSFLYRTTVQNASGTWKVAEIVRDKKC